MRSSASLAIGALPALGEVEEPAAQVRPAEGERDGLAGRLGGKLLVSRVAVALHDAAIAVEQLQRMHRAAAGRVGESDGRRIGPAPGSIVAGDRPEVAVLDPAAARIEHRRLRLVDRDLAGGEDQFAQPQIERLEFVRRIAHPERQDRSLDVEALRGQHLGLPIERQMPGVFGDQHGGDHRLGRKPALDQPLGGRRLHHRLLAGPAGEFGTVRHDRPELRRDHVEPLGGFLADHVHGRAAARAGRVLGLDRHMHARQMGGKRAALGAALFGASASALLILLVVGGFDRGDGLLDILERQGELVRVELLGPPAELHALQLTQEMLQAIDLRQRLVARRNASSRSASAAASRACNSATSIGG